MEHGLFKPSTFEEGQNAVVGDCNGYTMQQRWDAETPAFADAIVNFCRKDSEVLDYGCGVGRIAKAILDKKHGIYVTGVDASQEMLAKAKEYVADTFGYFTALFPWQLANQKFDVVYCVYVLQHIPAIELRDAVYRIHYHLKDDGYFIYCSSDYRMAIRYDGKGFFDDRFLGVNLQEELSRLFTIEKSLFTEEQLKNNEILKAMVKGENGLAHPALVLRKRKITGQPFNVKMEEKTIEPATFVKKQEYTKLLLMNRLSPGDVLVMTNAIRDLHKAYPNKYQTDVRTPCPELFQNNPYITKLAYDETRYQEENGKFSKLSGINPKDKHIAEIGDILAIDMHYPMIHTSGTCGWHFSYGHRDWLEQVLNIKIPQTDIRPEIYLDQNEKTWVSPVTTKCGHTGKYWVLNGGSKGDFTLKQYPYFQEVIDLLKEKITFVQIGQAGHHHQSFDGVVNMVGKTNLRELFRVIYHAEGLLTCVSLPMHVAAAFKKPCVVVAGAREGTRWELYSNHQFLYVNGCLPCASYDGCWRSKIEDCNNKVQKIPRCMTLIRPEDVVRAIERYYDGGMLEYEPLMKATYA